MSSLITENEEGDELLGNDKRKSFNLVNEKVKNNKRAKTVRRTGKRLA
jgi:hypothetical protein